MILIITTAEEVHVAPVVEALRKYDPNVDIAIVHTELFGQSSQHNIELTPHDTILNVGGRRINREQISAVWYRRIKFFPDYLHQVTNLKRDEWAFAYDQWMAAFENFFSDIDTLWVSPPDAVRQARRKVWQLKMAQDVGLRIPKTLVSNDVEAILTFLEENPRSIAKALAGGWLHREEKYYAIYTTRISRDLIWKRKREVSVAPFIIQEEIPKLFELRIYVVGMEVLAIRIESQKSPISSLDWRRYDLANTPYMSYDLPPSIAAKCRALVRNLGLQYGAIDMVVTPDKEFVFLEVNANGQFLWAERLSGVSVSKAIAKLLLGITPPLESRASCEEEKK